MEQDESVPEPRFNFKKANWEKYRRDLILPEISYSPEKTCAQLEKAVLKAAKENIPMTKSWILQNVNTFGMNTAVKLTN